MYVCVYGSLYMCMCIYVCECVCMCVCVCVYQAQVWLLRFENQYLRDKCWLERKDYFVQ